MNNSASPVKAALDTPYSFRPKDVGYVSNSLRKLSQNARKTAEKVCEFFINIAKTFFSIPLYPLRKLYDHITDDADPIIANWVQPTVGHFHRLKKKEDVEAAIKYAESLMQPLFVKDDIRMAYNVALKEQSELKGTCHGNCLTLAGRVIANGSTFSAKKLSEIEKERDFSHQALGIHIYKCNLQSITTRMLNKFTKILKIKVYEEVIKVGRDLLDTLEIALIRDKWHKNIIEQFRLFEDKKILEMQTVPVNDLLRKLPLRIPEIKQENHSGVYVLCSPTHAMFLQVNQEQNVYIFYDNNRGFYEWHDFNDCLQGIQKHLVKMRFKTIDAIGVVL